MHNIHNDGILHLSVASDAHPLQALAQDYASRVLQELDYVGVLAFEFFEVDGGLKANEIARVSIILDTGLLKALSAVSLKITCAPLRAYPCSTASVEHSAMLNFIGSVPEASKVLSIADCHLHDYSKAAKAGRKVGHATLRSATPERLQQQIVALEGLLNV